MAAKLTQQDVARDFQITRQAVSSWECGGSLPTVTQLYEVGILYGVSLDYLLYGVRTLPVESAGILAQIFREKALPTNPPTVGV